MFCFFFFNDTATTEIYTLSLHDALPIWEPRALALAPLQLEEELIGVGGDAPQLIELGVVAGGDHLAVAHQRGRLGGDGGSEQSHHVLVLVQDRKSVV